MKFAPECVYRGGRPDAPWRGCLPLADQDGGRRHNDIFPFLGGRGRTHRNHAGRAVFAFRAPDRQSIIELAGSVSGSRYAAGFGSRPGVTVSVRTKTPHLADRML